MIIITQCPKTVVTPAESDADRLDQLIVRAAELSYQDLAVYLSVPDTVEQFFVIGNATCLLVTKQGMKFYKQQVHTKIPGMADRIRNVTKAMGRLVTNATNGVELVAPQSIIEDRLATCYSCPHYKDGICADVIDSHGTVTKGCGCNLSVKTRLAGESCPYKKWTAIP